MGSGVWAEILREIVEKWQISESTVLSFQRASSCYTLPLGYDDGRLRLRVHGSPETQAKKLIFHEGAHVYLFDLSYPPATFPPSVIDFIAEYYAVSLEVQRSGDRSALSDPTAPSFMLDGIRARFLEVTESLSPPAFCDPRSEVVYHCCRDAPTVPPLPPKRQEFRKVETAMIERMLEQNLGRIFLPQYVGSVRITFMRKAQ